MPKKLPLFLVAASVLFCGALAALRGQAVVARPKLVLVLSIDQMRFDYLTRFGDLYNGGIRRLLDQGAVFTNAKYRHANTETGPGHSVILSGRHASHCGIVANTWYDPLLKKSINVVDDPVQLPIGGNGRSASPANFIGFTVGDFLKRHSAQSRIVGVSMKDRSAVLMGGRRADAAYWFENEGGNFITSTYYMQSAPEWLKRWNARKFADQYSEKLWERLLPDAKVYEKYAGKDAIEGEWDRKDIVFPHRIRHAPPVKEYYEDFRRTPFADEMVLLAALEAMKAHGLGEDSFTDILAIGFSATDVVGHTYGSDSQEAMDQLLRLDQTLQKLFEEIDRRVGFAQTWVVLTADHGSMPLVEMAQKRGLPAKRVRADAVEVVVKQALHAKFPGASGLIANYDAPNFYLSETALTASGLKQRAVEAVIVNALQATGWFESVYTHADILNPETQDDPHLPLIRNSFFAPRSAHIITTPKPYVYISDNVGGTGHGTPHDYDRHVPIVFLGSPVKPGRYSAECGPEDIAPTLAEMLALKGFEKEAGARILREMLR
ncbi:MAG: alkaline phosphatase family protein [Acidobacteria bacterium]|nr:alkaline phosphatase family protein [Acidobacteriota bacterium]MCI0723698.1 alkaline phosphatase family protein [Acidobacteriota bacterium]